MCRPLITSVPWLYAAGCASCHRSAYPAATTRTATKTFRRTIRRHGGCRPLEAAPSRLQAVFDRRERKNWRLRRSLRWWPPASFRRSTDWNQAFFHRFRRISIVGLILSAAFRNEKAHSARNMEHSFRIFWASFVDFWKVIFYGVLHKNCGTNMVLATGLGRGGKNQTNGMIQIHGLKCKWIECLYSIDPRTGKCGFKNLGFLGSFKVV